MDLHQEQERKQHLTNIEMFTSNAVAYNKAHSLQEGDRDANGTACWELAETMTYLFTGPTPPTSEWNKKPEPNQFAVFGMYSEKQAHQAVLLDGMVYEMCDGYMTINKYVDEAEVIRISSILIREKIVAIDIETLRLRKPFETAVLIANLLRLSPPQ